MKIYFQGRSKFDNGKKDAFGAWGSGVSGDKEFCKLLATMTMARLDPKRENTLLVVADILVVIKNHFGFLNGREKSFVALAFIRKNIIIIIGAWKYQQFFSCL